MINQPVMSSLPVNQHTAIIPYVIILYDTCVMKEHPEVITDNIAQYSTVTSYLTDLVGLSNPIGIIRLGYRAMYPNGDICGVQQAYQFSESARSILEYRKLSTLQEYFNIFANVSLARANRKITSFEVDLPIDNL